METAPAYRSTDLGNAELFAQLHADRLRYVKERRRWITWADVRWREDTTGEADRAAKEVARELLRRAADLNGSVQKDAARWALTSGQEPRIRAMLQLASTEPPIVLRADQLDADPYLLGCANGTLDLRTGGLLRPGEADDFISLGTDVVFDPEATCPRWQQFLAEIYDGDDELIQYVQRVIGYGLTGDTRERLVFILWGSGWNGKDTFLKPVQRILGDLAVTTPAESFTRSRGDKGVRNDLARLHRARLVIASESSADKRLDEAMVKLLSGRNRVAARFLYGEFFEYLPHYKIALVTNHKPRVDADDEAIWDRLRLIPFTQNFRGRADQTLDEKLEREASGILNWALSGCLAWQRDGLGEAPAVTRATADYRAEEDILGAFLAERCRLDPNTMIEPDQLRSAFDDYCRDTGEQPIPPNVLGKRLKQRGLKRATRDGRSVYTGATLR